MVWQQHIENYNLALVTRVTHNIGMSKEKVVLENEGLQREEVEEGYEEEAEEGKMIWRKRIDQTPQPTTNLTTQPNKLVDVYGSTPTIVYPLMRKMIHNFVFSIKRWKQHSTIFSNPIIVLIISQYSKTLIVGCYQISMLVVN